MSHCYHQSNNKINHYPIINRAQTHNYNQNNHKKQLDPKSLNHHTNTVRGRRTQSEPLTLPLMASALCAGKWKVFAASAFGGRAGTSSSNSQYGLLFLRSTRRCSDTANLGYEESWRPRDILTLYAQQGSPGPLLCSTGMSKFGATWL